MIRRTSSDSTSDSKYSSSSSSSSIWQLLPDRVPCAREVTAVKTPLKVYRDLQTDVLYVYVMRSEWRERDVLSIVDS